MRYNRVVNSAEDAPFKQSYRPEIDGLRAIAVLAVVLFHCDFGFPGGFTGVDVFFVISGFLIGSHIWKELEEGSFSFWHFWERRVRRIVPAATVVTLFVLAFGTLFLLPQDLKDLGRASTWQAACVANVNYYLKANYFEGPSELKPLLHTWSLAVEEQFYFFLPLVMWATYKLARQHARKTMVGLMALTFGLSFVLSILVLPRDQSATFYMLPTRAWELLIGSLVAFIPAISSPQKREGLAMSGLGLVITPFFGYSTTTRFPGLAALPTCLGTALLIYANTPSSAGLTNVGRALSWRPLVFVGLISYSLYLWHWPLLAFSRYLAAGELTVIHRAVLIVASFACAVLSWKFVETPFRTRRMGASRKSLFVVAGVATAAVSAFGTLLWETQGFPSRVSEHSRLVATVSLERPFNKKIGTAEIRSGNLVRLGVGRAGAAPSVLLWGDSHAMAAATAFDIYLKQHGRSGVGVMHTSTPPVLNWYKIGLKGMNEESPTYNAAVVDYIEAHKIPNVVLTCYWTAASRDPSFTPAVVATVRRVKETGARVWILLDPPIQPFDVSRLLAREDIFRPDIESLCATPATTAAFDPADAAALGELRAAGATILDPKPFFLDPSKRFYVVQSGGWPLYRDGNHLSMVGAKRMLVPMLDKSGMLG